MPGDGRQEASVPAGSLANCPWCGYSLEGLPVEHRCPECGGQFDRPWQVFDCGSVIEASSKRRGWNPPDPLRGFAGLSLRVCLGLVGFTLIGRLSGCVEVTVQWPWPAVECAIYLAALVVLVILVKQALSPTAHFIACGEAELVIGDRANRHTVAYGWHQVRGADLQPAFVLWLCDAESTFESGRRTAMVQCVRLINERKAAQLRVED